MRFVLVLGAAAVLLTSCSRSSEPKSEEKSAAEAKAPATAAQGFKVRFDTSKGPFLVEVHPEWAPLGAARFRELVEDKFYDGARFFRVVPNLIVQVGIPGDPRMHRKWDKPIKDDEPLRTNSYKSLAFATAGPETRTTQIFINLRSNQTLDKQGFAPFATVIEGMEVVEKLNAEYREQPDQSRIERQGNAYLNASFPRLDYIRTARIVQ